MSRLYYQASCTLDSASAEGDEWNVTISVSDSEGTNTANRIETGDVIALDANALQNGIITLFDVQEVIESSFGSDQAELRIKQSPKNDGGLDNADLTWLIGTSGVVVRPSENLGLLPVPAPSYQRIPDRFSFYLQNYNFKYTLDNLDLEAGDGEDGKSAYELAVEDGFEGTEEEWLESLQGKSAYDLAVDQGYEGTEEDWLESLQAYAEVENPPDDGKHYVRKGDSWVDLESMILDMGEFSDG